YLLGKKAGAKAWHHKFRRVGLQESCPQNNFRRLIASLIPSDEFCNHKINYFPEPESKLPLEFLLGLLNSKLADWYFRLGSTNASVSHYQLYNLPCPSLSDSSNGDDRSLLERTVKTINSGALAAARKLLESAVAEPPFGAAVRE